MLQVIRDRAQSWIAWVIVILIIIPFALWGIQQYLGGGEEASAASVNGVKISPRELQQAVYQQQQRLRQMLGDNYRPGLIPDAQLRQQALAGLIERELLVQTAVTAGMRIGDPHLAVTIRSIPAFQQSGEFSQQTYEQMLRSQGMSVDYFEADLRRDLLTQQFYTSLVRSDFATPHERSEYVRLKRQTRDIGYLLLPAERYADKVQVGEEEIAAYYADNPRLFVVPEQVKLAYLELSVDALKQEFQVDEAELRDRYQAQQVNYRSTEQRRARHILLTLPPDAAPEQEEAVRTKAETLLAELRAGAAFEELAKKHSEDPGSAKQGGDLGFFGKGVMVPAFEEAVFALKPGELSAPVRSTFGYHIIRLEEVSGGQTKSFEQVREQILDEIRTERAEQLFYEQSEVLANLSYEHPDTLATAAEELGLTVEESPFISRRGGEGLFSNPNLITAAFSEDVLARGNNSEPLEVGTNHLVVLRVRQHEPEHRRPLEEVRDEVVKRLTREKANELAVAEADGIIERLKAGEAPEALAKEFKLEWQDKPGLGRDNAELKQALVRAVFAMPRPQAETAPALQRVPLPGGEQAVVALRAVHDGSVPEGDEESLRLASDELERASGEAGFNAALRSIRARNDVQVTPQKLSDG